MDQIPICAVRNVYLNNYAYICSGSLSPLPFLSREVPQSYRPREKDEAEVVFITSMPYPHRRDNNKSKLHVVPHTDKERFHPILIVKHSLSGWLSIMWNVLGYSE